MTVLFTALFLTALSTHTIPPRASAAVAWPLAQLHETSISLERFPPGERSAVLALLKPYLGPLFQGESTEQMNEVIHSFRAERLTLGGSLALAVQSTGNELCGVSGNCSFWIIDLRHRRVLLNAIGIQKFSVSSTRAGRIPDIITGSHASALEEELIRWQFQGSSYNREDCATATYASDDGQPYPTPKITSHPCEAEGN